MSSGLRRWLSCGLLLLLAHPARANAAPSVFVLFDAGGSTWHGTAVQRPVAGDIFVEQTFERQDGLARIVVVRSAAPVDPARPGSDFTATLKHLFAAGSGPATFDAPVHRLGRDGRELRFAFERDQRTYHCEFFVFVDHAVHWGILCARAAGHPDTPASLLDLLFEKPAAPPGAVELAPFVVHEDALSSFPISLRLVFSRAGHRIEHIFVTRAPSSARAGLTGGFVSGQGDESPIEVGDEIVAIDGRPSQEFDAAMGRDTELGRIFLNRHPGDTVDLELISARTHERYKFTLRVARIQFPFGN